MKVIIGSPLWSLNGVNVFAANLARGLIAAGVQAHILLTEPHQPDPKPLPRPDDIRFETLPAGRWASWPARWQALIRYLEDRAPCVYLPNHDFRHSCISPRLPGSVGIVGIVHSDDPQHYEHAQRLGRYWDAIVAVSPAIAQRVAASDPSLAPRLRVIPYGVEAPAAPPARPGRDGAPLRIVYAGRLAQAQKRVLDLPPIMAALAARATPAQWTIIGAGHDEASLRAACAALGDRVAVAFPGVLANAQMPAVFAQADALVLPSQFEGLPLSVLEAMAWGCVPVVSDVRSGIPELIRDGVNGYRVPPGDSEAFAARLVGLQRDPVRRQMLAEEAHRTIVTGGYRREEMATRYAALFETLFTGTRSGTFRRPRGRIVPSPDMTWKDAIPPGLRGALSVWRRRLRGQEQ